MVYNSLNTKVRSECLILPLYHGSKLLNKTYFVRFHNFFAILSRKMCARVRNEAKIIEFVKKKRHGHSFAPNGPIIHQNEPTTLPALIVGGV